MLRLVTAAAVLTSAYVHVVLWFDGYRDLDVIGPLFLLNAVAGAVIGVAILAWRHWLPCLLGAGFGAATLSAFVISATVGLAGINATWSGTFELIAAAAELVAIVAGLASARQLQQGPA